MGMKAGSALDWDTWPQSAWRIWMRQARLSDGHTCLSCFISGNSLTANDATVFLGDTTAPQGQANFRVNGNDTQLRVLIMQLVVNVGQHVRRTINIDVEIGAPGSYVSFSALDQTFSSVPAPNGSL